MPVFRDRIDNIVGFVHVFDVLAAEDMNQTVASVARPARFVPETVPAIDLLVDLLGDRVAADGIARATDRLDLQAGFNSLAQILIGEHVCLCRFDAVEPSPF